jgi:pimeloyl-[acyl-carrier protein] methyl ester esterase
MAWAHADPARVRRLVLIGTTPKFVAGPDWPHAMARETLYRFADELRVAYAPTLRRFLALQVQGSDEGRTTLAQLRDGLFAHGVPDASVLRDALDELAAIDVRGLVRSITQPALVIAGDRDTLTPLPAARWLADELPGATLLVVPGAAHAPFLSHPALVLGALRDFLADG